MPDIGTIAAKVRSKNAGPFWVTVDIFCGTGEAFQQVSEGLSTERLAKILGVSSNAIKRFDIASLNVVKFSIPRPEVQGSKADSDMHGAALGAFIQEIEL